MKGALDFDYLKSLFKPLPKKTSRFDLSESMDRVLGSVEELRSALRQTGSLHLKSFVQGSPGGELCLSQSDEGIQVPETRARGLRAHLRLSDRGDKNHAASLKLKLKDFSIKGERIETVLKNLSFSNQSISLKRISKLRQDFGESRLRIGEIELSGRLEGRLPAFTLISNSSKGLEEGMFISESNRTKVALGYRYDSLSPSW